MALQFVFAGHFPEVFFGYTALVWDFMLRGSRHDDFYCVVFAGLSVISRIILHDPDYFRVLRHNFRSLGLQSVSPD